MIELTYATLNNRQFMDAINYLKKQNTFKGFQASYNFARMYKQISKELTAAQQLYTVELLDKHLEKDAEGKPILAETPSSLTPWKIKDNALLEKELEEFLKIKVKIESYPLEKETLEALALSPEQIIALEPIFDLESLSQKES